MIMILERLWIIVDVDEIELFYEFHHEVLTIDMVKLPYGENVRGFRQASISKE